MNRTARNKRIAEQFEYNDGWRFINATRLTHKEAEAAMLPAEGWFWVECVQTSSVAEIERTKFWLSIVFCDEKNVDEASGCAFTYSTYIDFLRAKADILDIMNSRNCDYEYTEITAEARATDYVIKSDIDAQKYDDGSVFEEPIGDDYDDDSAYSLYDDEDEEEEEAQDDDGSY